MHFDRPRLLKRRRDEVVLAGGGGVNAVHGVREVDGRGAGVAQHLAGPLQRGPGRIAHELHHHSVGGGHADQGRAADREAADRLGDRRRAVEH